MCSFREKNNDIKKEKEKNEKNQSEKSVVVNIFFLNYIESCHINNQNKPTEKKT